MTESYKVSILVPIYGVEKYIERCVRSLFEQTYENIEYIFVNDCTNDKSIEILKKISREYPIREKQTHIINHYTNKGLAASRNTAVDYSTGNFIMHVDSDDYLDIDTVECVMRAQQKGNYDIVTFGFYKEYENKTIIETPINIKKPIEMCKAIIERNAFVGIWARLYRSSLYKENGIYTSIGNDMGEDYQVAPRLVYYANKIYNLQIPKYHYNLMNNSSFINSFSIKKNQQLFNSSNYLFDFFDGNDSFYKSICIGKLKVGAILLHNCIRGNLGFEEFKKYNIYIKNISTKYYKFLDLQQLIIVIIKNYKILHFVYKIKDCISNFRY